MIGSCLQKMKENHDVNGFMDEGRKKSVAPGVVLLGLEGECTT